MVYNATSALNLVKDRLNRMRVATPDDEYLKSRIEAAAQELKRNGINLMDTTDDLMLLVDMTVWRYQNRDKMTGMPEWLRAARRERFLADRRLHEEAESACC
ncbi:MAG: hypothetical protein IKK34_01810 [Clostridia bacterium]|nr:hypothetical protein [Clostridia bacterium]